MVKSNIFHFKRTMDKNKIKQRFINQAKSATFQNIISRYKLNEKIVLDIGCAYGEHLIHFGEQSQGITIEPTEAIFGKEEKKLDIIVCNIESEDIKKIEKKFDVIFANNILEHLTSPHLFLINIKKLLKDDGLLILGVPCIPKIISLLFIKKFKGSLASTHINFFTKYTLYKTVERANWHIEKISGFRFNNLLDKIFEPVYPHFYIIAKKKVKN